MSAELDRVRASYDAIAERYAEELGDELAGKPVDRALYRLFAELVRDIPEAAAGGAGRSGPVVGDVGCGPGHVAAYLAELGLVTTGVDASPVMVEVARRRYPGIRFEVGALDRLPAADGGWAGAVAAYSVIHLDHDGRLAAFAELRRALVAGGWLLVAFHVSDADHDPGAVNHVERMWDTEIRLDFRFLDPVLVAAELADCGFTLVSRTDREPWPGVEHPSRRSYLLARRG